MSIRHNKCPRLAKVFLSSRANAPVNGRRETMCKTCSLLIVLIGPGICFGDGAKSPTLEELAKEPSPKAMVQAWVMATLRGDAETVKAGFDLTTENGRRSAEAAQAAARIIRASNALGDAARRKYGKAGLEMGENALKAKLI